MDSVVAWEHGRIASLTRGSVGSRACGGRSSVCWCCRRWSSAGYHRAECSEEWILRECTWGFVMAEGELRSCCIRKSTADSTGGLWSISVDRPICWRCGLDTVQGPQVLKKPGRKVSMRTAVSSTNQSRCLNIRCRKEPVRQSFLRPPLSCTNTHNWRY